MKGGVGSNPTFRAMLNAVCDNFSVTNGIFCAFCPLRKHPKYISQGKDDAKYDAGQRDMWKEELDFEVVCTADLLKLTEIIGDAILYGEKWMEAICQQL
ncbi:MAG: hypothetical protein IJ719_11365 [Clostridia bacterium]|nr:hypothetical protein [Clostridia bacterium]